MNHWLTRLFWFSFTLAGVTLLANFRRGDGAISLVLCATLGCVWGTIFASGWWTLGATILASFFINELAMSPTGDFPPPVERTIAIATGGPILFQIAWIEWRAVSREWRQAP